MTHAAFYLNELIRSHARTQTRNRTMHGMCFEIHNNSFEGMKEERKETKNDKKKTTNGS